LVYCYTKLLMQSWMVDDLSNGGGDALASAPEGDEAQSAIECARKDVLNVAKGILPKSDADARRVMLYYLCASTGEGRIVEGERQLVHVDADSGEEAYEKRAEPVFSPPSLMPYEAKGFSKQCSHIDFSTEIKQSFRHWLLLERGRGDYALKIAEIFPDVVTEGYIEEVRSELLQNDDLSNSSHSQLRGEGRSLALGILDSSIAAKNRSR